MAGDLNREASELWNSLKPIIDKEIDARTQGVVQRRKAKVTTAPSLVTKKIGVTEPFGTEMLIPFTTNLISATVGDVVWVEFMYGLTNAFASMFASADEKDWDVAGDLSVVGNAGISGNLDVSGSTSLQNTTVNGVLDVTPWRCYASLSSAGWYRVLKIVGGAGAWSFSVDFDITRAYNNTNNEVHSVKLLKTYNATPSFVNEVSKTNAFTVSAIRYTIDSDGVGYVDIRYDANSENTVTVDFTVHTNPAQQQYFTAQSLQSVGASPSGETVLTEYTFGANGTFLQNINGFLNPERTTIANGATRNIQFANSSSAYLLMTGVNAKCFVLCAVRASSSGTISHGETIIGSGTIGATFSTSTNTLSITNSSGNELQILILRF